jgi:hypothetical protein
MWGIFGIAEEMLASQEELCSMELVSQSVGKTSLFRSFGEIKFLRVWGD